MPIWVFVLYTVTVGASCWFSGWFFGAAHEVHRQVKDLRHTTETPVERDA